MCVCEREHVIGDSKSKLRMCNGDELVRFFGPTETTTMRNVNIVHIAKTSPIVGSFAVFLVFFIHRAIWCACTCNLCLMHVFSSSRCLHITLSLSLSLTLSLSRSRFPLSLPISFSFSLFLAVSVSFSFLQFAISATYTTNSGSETLCVE